MAHVVTDLEAYYDRQLTNIKSIMLESIGVDRKAVKLFVQVIPAL